jgi:hypothetical protein
VISLPFDAGFSGQKASPLLTLSLETLSTLLSSFISAQVLPNFRLKIYGERFSYFPHTSLLLEGPFATDFLIIWQSFTFVTLITKAVAHSQSSVKLTPRYAILTQRYAILTPRYVA